VKLPGGAPSPQEMKEMTRTFVCFEFLKPEYKQRLFLAILQTWKRNKLDPSDWWLFSRILSRRMQYADFTRCLPPSSAIPFFEELQRKPRQQPELKNVLGSLFHERADRSLGFDSTWIESLTDLYSLQEQVLEDTQAQRYCFGEALPLGLKLLSS